MTAAVLWQLSHRADPKARDIADRHYNRQKIGTPGDIILDGPNGSP